MVSYQLISTPTLQHKIPAGIFLADLSPSKSDIRLSKYGAKPQSTEQGISASHVRADKTAWGKWTKFTTWLGVRADLSDVRYPVPILQFFSHRVRADLLVERGLHIQNHSVNQYLLSVGQIFASVGAIDQRMDTLVNVNFWL